MASPHLSQDRWLLGLRYPRGPDPDPNFMQDFRSRIWFTYRTNFPEIETSGFRSDTGWGCTLRSAQMILAQGLLTHYLGRSWRLADDSSVPNDEGYIKILKLFFDYPAPFCPFSIHNLLANRPLAVKKVGEWFGPESSCLALRGCTEAVDPIVVQGLPKIIVTAAGQLCFEELRDSMTKSVSQSLEPEPQSSESKGPDLNHAIADSSDQPIIIFVPLRLGLESINPIYIPPLLKLFELPQCLGCVGGKPRSSLYFVGTEGDSLLYLDPHTTQEPPPMNLAYLKQSQASSFHCGKVGGIEASNIDPSLVVGFYCLNTAQLKFLWESLLELEKQTEEGFLFSLLETKPEAGASDSEAAQSEDTVEEDDFVLL